MISVNAIYFYSSKNGEIPKYERIFELGDQEDTTAYGNIKGFLVRWADVNDAPGFYCSEELAFLF